MKTPSSPRKFRNRVFAPIAMAFGILVCGEIQAATIIWEPVATISGDSDVETSGTTVLALNVGRNSSTTINGVTFDAAIGSDSLAITLGGSAEGALQMVNTTNNWSAAETFSSQTNPYTSLTSDYKSMLRSAIYISSGSVSTATYNLLNLEVGQEYLLQLWINDPRDTTANRDNTFTSGANSVTLDFNTSDADGGMGQFVIGTFTADATTQDISVSLPSGAEQVIQLNGYQIRAIPEPSALTLLGFAIGITIFLRRGRRLC